MSTTVVELVISEKTTAVLHWTKIARNEVLQAISQFFAELMQVAKVQVENSTLRKLSFSLTLVQLVTLSIVLPGKTLGREE